MSSALIEGRTFEGDIAVRRHTDQNRRLPVRLQLWATLYWMRVYPTMRVASAYLKIPVMYLKKVLTRVIPALSELAESVGRDEGGLAWPTIAGLAIGRAEPSVMSFDCRCDWTNRIFSSPVASSMRRIVKHGAIAYTSLLCARRTRPALSSLLSSLCSALASASLT
jgi:hypothetical protein